MIYPPIFSTCSADSGVTGLFGSNPCRVFPFGVAEGATENRPTKPYAVWQVISGVPENYLGQRPDTDSWTLQIDVYADTATAARNGAVAIRDAIEPYSHVVGWRGESKDPDTKNYRCSFDVDWFTERNPVS